MSNRCGGILFSIILPAYNVSKTIDRCLASCMNQTYTGFEIIVVDDCGADDSIEKAEQWAEKDPRVKVIKNPRNLGTYHARRIGVETAEGKYVLFLDPDDAIHSEALCIIHNRIKEKDVDIIFYGVTEVPKKKKNKVSLPEDSSNNNEVFSNVFFKSSTLSYGTPGKAFSRRVLNKAYAAVNANIQDRLVYAEDVLLFYAVALYSQRTVSIDMPLYSYYREFNSITARNNADEVAFKTRQIYLIASYLYKILSSDSNMPELGESAGKKVVGKILSDAALVKRNAKSRLGKDQYMDCVFESLRMRGGYPDAVRLAVYIFSFGLIKL